MFKKLKEKLDETGLKNKLLDYAANASSGGGEASGNKSQSTPSNPVNKKESGDIPSSPEQSPDVTLVDWSVKGEPPPIGWAPPVASPPSVSKVSVLPSDTEESEVDDVNTSLEGVSKEKLLTELTKWHARYQRIKDKYTQRVSAYKELNYEKEKIQTALAETQDRLLRRQAELREQCILEQQAKAHLEQNLRVTIEEKDQLISVLETKVDLLKSGKGQPEESEHTDQQPNEDVEELQKKVKRLEELLNRCRATLNSNKEQSALMKKQLEEKDKEVKHALEQEIRLKEQLLFWEQENQKECESCHRLKEIQQGMQSKMNELLQQFQNQQERCRALEEEQKTTASIVEENRLLQQELESTEKNFSDLLQQAKMDSELKEQNHVSALQLLEDKCHTLELQVEDLQTKETEKDLLLERSLENIRTEKRRVEEEVNVKSQQIESLMHELKRESEETVQLKVQCTKLESLTREKEEEKERLQTSWCERENLLQDEVKIWKEKCNTFEENIKESVASNDKLQLAKAEFEKALQDAQDASLYAKNVDQECAEKVKSLEMQLEQVVVSADKRASKDCETITQLREKCDRLESHFEDKEKELHEAVRNFESERELFVKLREEWEAKEQQNEENISCLTREREELRNLGEEFRSREDWQKQIISSLEEKCSSLENSVHRKDSELSDAKELYEKKCEEMSAQVCAKDRDLADLGSMLEAKLRELETVSKERDEGVNGCQALDIKCQNLIGQLSSIQNDSSHTIQELQSKCAELQAVLDLNSNASSEQFRGFEERRVRLQEEFAEKEKSFERELQTWKENYTLLEMSLKEAENKNLTAAKSFDDSIREMTEKFQHERSRIEDRVRELEVERQHLENKMEETNTARQTLEKECSRLDQSLCEEKEQDTQKINDLEAKCEALQTELTEKEAEILDKQQANCKEIESLKQQLYLQTEEHKVILSKLDLKIKESASLEEQQIEFSSKLGDLEQECLTHQGKLLESEESSHARIAELEDRLQAVQTEHEEKLAAFSVSESGLMEECAQLRAQLVSAENQLHTKVSSLEQEIKYLEASLSDDKSKSNREKELLEDRCQLLETQLNDVNETVRTAEERCQDLQLSLQNVNQEKDNLVGELQNKCRELETQLKQNNNSANEAHQTWESKYSEMEMLFAEKELEAAEQVRLLEVKQADLSGQIILVETLQEKCGDLENQIQEYAHRLSMVEEASQEAENRFKGKENEVIEIRAELDEKIHQNEVLKEAEMRFFEKTQSLEQQCQQLENQLDEQKVSSTALANNFKDKCLHLEEELMHQSSDNNRKTTQLQEKCQRLEIQLKDIEEDSSQTIKTLEDRCQILEQALQSKDISLLKEQCHNLENELKTDSIINIPNCNDPDSKHVNNVSESYDATDSWQEKCKTLTEKETQMTSIIKSLNERLSDVENLLAEEKNRGSQFVQRLSRFEDSVKKSGGPVDVRASDVTEWNAKAEAILDEIEKSLLSVTSNEGQVLPEIASLFEDGLPENPNQSQIKQLMQAISKQIQNKDAEHEREVQLIVERAEAVEQRFMQQESLEMQEMAKEIAAQTAANEEIREHFLLQLQEKDAEIQSLQKQMQVTDGNKKSDWDNAWDMEEDEMCNNAPVQNLVNKELQAVMEDNKADLDQLERFLAYPSGSPSNPRVSLEPTEYEYLRNILLAYMTGREPLIMAKVITAVMRFPEKDTQDIIRRETMKSSVS